MIELVIKLLASAFLVLDIVTMPFGLRAVRARRRARIEAMNP